MARHKVLVVEDEEDIGRLVGITLTREGYKVENAESAEDAMRKIDSFQPELLVLDLMLPGMSGLDFCRKLKKSPETASIGIVMLTAKGEEADIVAGLESGADDYVVKPFSPKVLGARVKAVFRRKLTESGAASQGAENVTGKPDILKFGLLEIDLQKRIVTIGREQLYLTYSEFQILGFLASRPGHVFTRLQIVESFRGDDYHVTNRVVDVQVAGLRKKLGKLAGLVETVRGVGYRWAEK